ncbi:MAG: PQQ-dependent sugar dehydrogenase [Oceanicaulis sp.]
MIRIAAPAAAGLCLAACIAEPEAPELAEIDPATYAVEVVAGGLAHPWDIAFLPGGDMLVTERPGRLRVISGGVLQDEPVSGVPEVYAEGQGGLLEIMLAPDFADSRIVYISYASGDAEANATSVMKARYEDGALTGGEVIFTSSPAKDTTTHFGGRMAVLPDSSIVLTLGDGFAYREQAQLATNHLGTIVRFTPGGAPAPGNPFIDQDGPAAFVWSYGHRNVQGIVFDAQSGLLYAHEHGPEGGDELNLIERGGNYGWPIVTGGVDYNGARISPYTDHEAHGFIAPMIEWTPSIAPGGMTLYDGALFEDWRGDLFVSALSERAIHRIDLDASGAVQSEEVMLTERGQRFRQIATGPDGALYVLTDGGGDGEVLRITPAG